MTSRPFAAIVVILACAACAGRANNRGAEPGQSTTITVEAINDNYYDARVHAVFTGGQRRALGTIAGNGGRNQIVLAWEPRALVFAVSFVIDGAAYVSHPVDVSPGEFIEVRLPPNIDESGFFRRVSRSTAFQE